MTVNTNWTMTHRGFALSTGDLISSLQEWSEACSSNNNEVELLIIRRKS